jgi:uncharacterized glyoxalase superfamily protein PhnB
MSFSNFFFCNVGNPRANQPQTIIRRSITSDERDFQNLLDNDITIIREPANEEYGKVAVFKDIYGNLWDLIEPSSN